MAGRRITVEEDHLSREKVKKAGLTPDKIGRCKLARLLGITEARACGLLKRWRGQAGQSAESGAGLAATDETSGNTRNLTLNRTRIHTLDQLLAHFNVDTKAWEVDRFVVNKWEVGAIPRTVGSSANWSRKSTKIMVEPLYQVKAWLKKKVVQIAVREEINAMIAEAKRRAPKYAAIARRKDPAGNMLEISLPDQHFGRLSWGKETGQPDYDTRIAERQFKEALAALLARVRWCKFSKILYVVGNDLFEADNREGTTTRGTQQTTDYRQQKTFGIVRHAQVKTIEQLRLIAPVDVYMVPGNHDTLTNYYLGDSLECWFHRCSDVQVENAPTQRKYYQWGRVMVMFVHGDKGKAKDYPLLMATERREMFGATNWHEVHTGHTHQVRLEEQHGVRVRILPSLAASSHWESEQTFVGNIRSAEAYVWNKDEGLMGTATYAVPRGGAK